MNDEVEANLERSRRLYEEIFGNGNYAAADELMTVGIVNHGPGLPAVLGTDGIKRQAALLRSAIPDLRIILYDQFGHEDRVVSRWTGRGTHTGPLALPAGTVEGTLATASPSTRSGSTGTTTAVSQSPGGYPTGSPSGSSSACCQTSRFRRPRARNSSRKTPPR